MTDTERTNAKAIVDRWYWQPASGHNYRYKEAPSTLVRYYEAAPMSGDQLKIILEYLREESVETSIMLAGKPFELEGTWKSADVWLQTADGDKRAGTESTKIRIYQALVKAAEGETDGPYTIEDGCAYKVSHEFFFNRAETPTLPKSSSGVNYTIQGINIDRETGLISGVIEKRERVQQTVKSFVAVETAFEKREDEQHIGVKEGAAGALMERGELAQGETLTIEVAKNDDCTRNISKRKVTEKPQAGTVKVTRKTLRTKTKSVTDRNQPAEPTEEELAALKVGETVRSEMTEGKNFNITKESTEVATGLKLVQDVTKSAFSEMKSEQTVAEAMTEDLKPVEVADGKVTRKTERRNDDGSVEVTTQETTEIKVEGAVKTARKSLRTITKSVTDRNQPTQPSEAEIAALKVGEMVRSEMTEGKNFNITKESTEVVTGVKIIQETVDTAFETTTTTQQTVAAMTEEFKPVAVTDGKVTRKTERQNEDMSVDETVIESTEKRVEDAVVVEQVTPQGTIKTTTLRSGKNEDVPSEAIAGMGKSRRLEKTQGGRTNVTESEVTAAAGEVAKVETATPIAHTSQTTENVLTKPTKLTDNGEQMTVTVGEKRVEWRYNGAGTVDKVTTEVTPSEVITEWITWSSTTVTPGGTYNYDHGVRFFRNVAKADIATKVNPGKGSNVHINANFNQWGLLDGAVTYTDLKSWTQNASGSLGGSQEGTITVYEYRTLPTGRRQKRSVTLKVRKYYGTGNEGSEASAAVNGHYYPGVKLPSRTYITAAPTLGTWSFE